LHCVEVIILTFDIVILSLVNNLQRKSAIFLDELPISIYELWV